MSLPLFLQRPCPHCCPTSIGFSAVITTDFYKVLTAGLGALFVMGIFFLRISGRAALIGVLAGIVILILVKNETTLSFLLYGFTGLVYSVLLALIFSFVFPNRKEITEYLWKKHQKFSDRD